MPFEITCTAWKALFQEKLLHWRER